MEIWNHLNITNYLNHYTSVREHSTALKYHIVGYFSGRSCCWRRVRTLLAAAEEPDSAQTVTFLDHQGRWTRRPETWRKWEQYKPLNTENGGGETAAAHLVKLGSWWKGRSVDQEEQLGTRRPDPWELGQRSRAGRVWMAGGVTEFIWATRTQAPQETKARLQCWESSVHTPRQQTFTKCWGQSTLFICLCVLRLLVTWVMRHVKNEP